jgi:hypothetical protein
LEEDGRISLKATQVIALSAITETQFKHNTEYAVLFDKFMEKPVNFDLLEVILKSYE